MTESIFHYVGTESFATPKADAAVDVVFVHGLSGDPYKTWAATDDPKDFWPRWLAEDVLTANVWTAGYDASPFIKALSGEGGSIHDRSTSLLDFLVANSLGTRPIVFVVHSLGGLIVKQMLRACADSSNAKCKQLLSETRGIVFCGTPHEGAAIATAVKNVLNLAASRVIKQLALSDEALLELHNWFREWVAQAHPEIRSYHEELKTKTVMVVSRGSSNPGLAGCVSVAITADHIAMCKPTTHEAQLYVGVKKLVSEIADAASVASQPQWGYPAIGNGVPTKALSTVVMLPKPILPALLAPIEAMTGDTEVIKIEPKAPPEILTDYEYFITQAPHDRRPLTEKLEAAGRNYEVKDAKRKKERFAMSLQRHSAQASSLVRYTRLMSDVETRFNRHVRPAIEKGDSEAQINKLVQDMIIEPVFASQLSQTEDVTPTLIENTLYYLTGNCHVRWDADKD
jgi:pimeloyl-ACP methyl ester carboxylesterase